MPQVVTITIPPDCALVPSVGTKVEPGLDLFTKSIFKETKLQITNSLGVKNEEIFKFLLKDIGETVTMGEVIAQKKKTIGSKKLLSSTTGTIGNIDHNTGEITIVSQASTDSAEIISAFFNGKVTKIDSKKNLFEIEIADGPNFEGSELANDFGGEAYFLNDNIEIAKPTETEVSNKVIVAVSLPDSLITKMQVLGAAGFIVGSPIIGDSLNVARAKKDKDLDSMQKSGKHFILVSCYDKKIYLYN